MPSKSLNGSYQDNFKIFIKLMDRLSPRSLSSALDSQFGWASGLYGRMVAWDEYDHYDEYV